MSTLSSFLCLIKIQGGPEVGMQFRKNVLEKIGLGNLLLETHNVKVSLSAERTVSPS